MVKLQCFSIIFLWLGILYGLRIDGRRLMGMPEEFSSISCGTDSDKLINCTEDDECKDTGYIKCVKGYCCQVIMDVIAIDPPAPNLLPPTIMLSSSSNNNLLVVMEEGRQHYPFMLQPSLRTTTPRQLGDNEEDVDDINNKNSQENQDEELSGKDDVDELTESEDDQLNTPLEIQDNQSSNSIVYDDEDDNNELVENQDDNQLKRSYEIYQDDQSGGGTTSRSRGGTLENFALGDGMLKSRWKKWENDDAVKKRRKGRGPAVQKLPEDKWISEKQGTTGDSPFIQAPKKTLSRKRRRTGPGDQTLPKDEWIHENPGKAGDLDELAESQDNQSKEADNGDGQNKIIEDLINGEWVERSPRKPRGQFAKNSVHEAGGWVHVDPRKEGDGIFIDARDEMDTDEEWIQENPGDVQFNEAPRNPYPQPIQWVYDNFEH